MSTDYVLGPTLKGITALNLQIAISIDRTENWGIISNAELRFKPRHSGSKSHIPEHCSLLPGTDKCLAEESMLGYFHNSNNTLILYLGKINTLRVYYMQQILIILARGIYAQLLSNCMSTREFSHPIFREAFSHLALPLTSSPTQVITASSALHNSSLLHFYCSLWDYNFLLHIYLPY